MMRSSIAKRLFLNLSVMLLLLWLLVIFAVSWVIRYETNEVFDSSLQETAQRILPLALRQIQPQATNQDLDPAPHDEYLSYQVINLEGQVLLRSHNAPLEPFTRTHDKGFYHQDNQVVYVEPSADNTVFIAVAESEGHRISTIKDTLIFLALPVFLLIPLTGLMVFVAIRNAQHAITILGQEVSERGSTDLHPLEITCLPQELVGLGSSINSLMGRLKQALESERNFTANSAHELRTPIAAALAQMDVLKSEVYGEQRKRVMDARNMLARLEGVTVKLLQLARAEAGIGLNLVAVDLVSIVKIVLKDFQFRERLSVQMNIGEQPVLVKGDVDMIGIVIQNLLENAYKYSKKGSEIKVSISADGSLTVINDCKTVSCEMLSVISERFRRGNEHEPGSGLGLAIVETISRQSGARFDIQSPCLPSGRGFKAQVNFNLA